MNREEDARSVLSRTSGFIAAAGFTHSLNPARNCTYGCTYCYVPTMRIQAGLQPEDWHCGGQFTTFKSNAAILAWRQVTGRERIYCSPLVDPYQPAEQTRSLMPDLLAALTDQSARRVHPFLPVQLARWPPPCENVVLGEAETPMAEPAWKAVTPRTVSLRPVRFRSHSPPPRNS